MTLPLEGPEVFRGLVSLQTVLVAPSIQPAVVDASDLPSLGPPVDADTIRSPVVTQYRFRAHLLQVEPPRVSLVTLRPDPTAVDQHREAINDFANAYLGRKGLSAMGFNVQIRRRSAGMELSPAELLRTLVDRRLPAVLSGESPAEIGLTVQYPTPLADGGSIIIEPSRTEDLRSVYFGFNYHYDMASPERTRSVDGVLRLLPETLADADALVDRFLSLLSEDPSRFGIASPLAGRPE